MQPPVQPTTQRKSPPLEPTEIVAIATMNAVGAVLLNPAFSQVESPAVVRASVEFEGCAGGRQVLDTKLIDEGNQPVDTAIARRLLEVSLPAPRDENFSVGKLLAGAVLVLLDVRHPGWADYEGSLGQAELHWQKRPDGTIETQIGGSIGYRRFVTNQYEIRSANGELTPYE